jgi:hypothetical protein
MGSASNSYLRPNLTVNRTRRFMPSPSVTVGAAARLPSTLGAQPHLRDSRVEWEIVSPTVLRAKGFRLLFFSREETRMCTSSLLKVRQNFGLSRELSLLKAMAYRRMRLT